MRLLGSVLACLMFAILVSGQEESKPDQQIVSKLKRIVEIREHFHREQLLLSELGQGTSSDVIKTANALTEAKIALAREKGDQVGELSELEALVENYRGLLAQEQARVDDGRALQSSLGELRVELLQAEIRVLRLKAGMPGIED